MEEDTKENLFTVFMVFLAIALGLFSGIGTGLKMQERRAIKAGVAYYTNDVDGNSLFKYHSSNKE